MDLKRNLGLAAAAAVTVSALGLAAPAHADASVCGSIRGHAKASCATGAARAKAAAEGPEADKFYGYCDRWVASLYGYDHSGYASAAAHWKAIPAEWKHPGATDVPAGALVFYTGGSQGAGHVMIAVGGGKYVTTDWPYPKQQFGTVTLATYTKAAKAAGMTYAGWAQPYFPG